MGYLKGVLPDGIAAAWVGVIVRRAAQLYISRLLALATRQEQEEEDEGGLVRSAVSTKYQQHDAPRQQPDILV